MQGDSGNAFSHRGLVHLVCKLNRGTRICDTSIRATFGAILRSGEQEASSRTQWKLERDIVLVRGDRCRRAGRLPGATTGWAHPQGLRGNSSNSRSGLSDGGWLVAPLRKVGLIGRQHYDSRYYPGSSDRPQSGDQRSSECREPLKVEAVGCTVTLARSESEGHPVRPGRLICLTRVPQLGLQSTGSVAVLPAPHLIAKVDCQRGHWPCECRNRAITRATRTRRNGHW